MRRAGRPRRDVGAGARYGCGFVEARREHRTVYNRIADSRVLEMLRLAHELLDDNAEHVAVCCRMDGG